jgi:hypothetical protein
MSQMVGAWNLRNVSPEARAAAKQAAARAGLPLGTWLAQLVREMDAQELAAWTPTAPTGDIAYEQPRLSSIERAMQQIRNPASELVTA